MEQVGAPDEVYDHPGNPFVMRFLGPVTEIDGTLVRPHDVEVSSTPEPGASRAAVTRVTRLGFEVRVELLIEGQQAGRGPSSGRWHMNVSARIEYGLRAMLVLAAAGHVNLTAQALADQQRMPLTFLHAILGELRRARLVRSQRGADGGYRLALPADQISVGDVIRVMDGSWGRGRRREAYPGAAEHLGQVWAAVDVAVWRVVDGLTLADLAAGRLSAHVRELLGVPAPTR